MPVPARVSRPWDLALDVVRGAAVFYRRNWVLIIGLSAIVSAERIIVQLAGASLPNWTPLPFEAAVTAIRILLIAIIFRRMIVDDPGIQGIGFSHGWQRVKRFAGACWGCLIVQAALLSVCVVLFDIVPEAAIGRFVRADAQPAYWAALLAIKNPTIIAFVMIWYVAALRQALLLGGPSPQTRTSRAAIPHRNEKRRPGGDAFLSQVRSALTR